MSKITKHTGGALSHERRRVSFFQPEQQTMILYITDGIEVAEHTEPDERMEFLREFKLAQLNVRSPGRHAACPAFLRRQAE